MRSILSSVGQSVSKNRLTLSKRRRRGSRALMDASRHMVEALEARWLLAANPIVTENQLPGTPESVWDFSGVGDTTLQGFSTDISTNVGGTVSFKINDTKKAPYRIDIYRMGYYQGNGARLITTIASSQTLDVVQPAPLTDAATRMTDCGNWSVTASWQVPTTAVSGIYFANLVRTDTGGESRIVFVVRNDASHSQVLFQTSDSTWEAYNTYGGNSLYGSTASSHDITTRSYAVSYNRPLVIDEAQGGYDDYNAPLHAEYPMVRWLEKNGYDVSYFTDVDAARLGASYIEQHQVYTSVGHDEYWSNQQGANVRAARDAGVNLAFFSGNESYWETRWTNSIDGGNTPYRTMVCYKESYGPPLDPTDPPGWTGTWRDPRQPGGSNPENALSGTMYMNDRTNVDLGIPMTVPASDANLRFWRNTAVAKLTAGQTASLGNYIVGYEVDEDIDNGRRPAGLMDMSSTTFSTQEHVISAWGTEVGPGTGTSSVTLYRAASGALVFGAGTIQWAWGLDGDHNDTTTTPDASMQQATVNLLADMGVQPATLQSGLVAATQSTDHTAPTSAITSPTPNATLSGLASVTVTGTATDAGGGVVAGVEVSVDGGVTWHPASGKNSWSYTFVPKVLGPFKILSRAVDDSANIETPSAGVTVNGAGPMSVWGEGVTPFGTSENDTSSIEVGMKFRSDVAGYVTGVRFYKGAGNTGSHVGALWSSSGTLLATATFTNETASGWQQVSFAQPVPVNPNTTYIVSYHAPAGHYAEDDYFFQTKGVDNTTLHALANGADGPNGVYVYSATTTFPNQTFLSGNFYVDVLFNTTANDTTPPAVASQSPNPGSTGVVPLTAVTVKFSEPLKLNTLSIVLRDPSNNAVAGSLAYDPSTSVATFTPLSPLASNTAYTVTVSGAQDLSGNTMSPTSWSFTTGVPAGQGPFSIFSPTSTPVTADDEDTGSTEVGVKFRSDVAGQITAIRFYKGPKNTGAHVGDLWTGTGQLLASGTFANETASGWQTLTFATPVTIAPGVTYIASYHTNVGQYAEDDNAFTNAGIDNGPLHALKSGVDGVNGVFAYGPAGTFPTQTWLNANYWVDVVFTTADTTPPTVTAKSPAAGATNVATNATVTATFSESVQSASVTFTLKDSGGHTVPATVAYNDATHTATLTPTAALAAGTTFTATVSGAMDAAGNVMSPPVTWSFTTAAPDTTPPTVTAQSPASGATNVALSTTVTATFSEPVVGSTIGVTLRDAGGNTAAGTAAYNAGTQTVTFTPTAALAASTVYTVTISGAQDLSGNVMSPVSWSFTTATPDTTPPSVTAHSPSTGATGVATTTTVTATFSEAIQSATLVFTLKDSGGNTVAASVAYNGTTFVATLTPSAALANNTTYTATVSGAKDLAGNVMSPVSWTFTTVPDTTPPTVTAQSPAPGSSGVAATITVTATFSEPVQPGTIAFALVDPGNNTVPATLSYNAATGVVTLTPSAPLTGSTTYTANLSGAKDLAGNTMSPVSWSFTTAVPIGGGPFSLWSPTATPGTAADPDTGAVEIGVKFTSDVSGFVTGIRFYKGTTNTGTHVGNLWSSTGTLLATGTFSGESASGWQQLNFATPVSITAGTVYVASYHTSVGHYAADNNYFSSTGVDNGPLHAPSDPVAGGNGVYAYGANSAFPSSTYQGSNYWVDVVFTKNYFLQSTAADFGGGTTGGSTITNNAGGEIQLTPSFQDDFNGSTLGSTWTTTALGGTAAVSLSGGILSLGSAEIRGGVTTLPVEARLTIAAVANQRFGLATDLAASAGNYWAVFTTNTTTNTLYGQVNLNGTLTTTSLGALSGFSGYHVYRVQPIATGFQFWVDGVLKLTIAKVIPAGTNLQIALGATAATPTMQVDWARLDSYTSGGTFVSSVLDAGRVATWGAAQLTAALPAGTSLLIETSSGNTATPDGTWSAFSALGSGNVITSPPARYLRYRITLITTDPTQTPTLSDILFAWS